MGAINFLVSNYTALMALFARHFGKHRDRSDLPSHVQKGVLFWIPCCWRPAIIVSFLSLQEPGTRRTSTTAELSTDSGPSSLRVSAASVEMPQQDSPRR